MPYPTVPHFQVPFEIAEDGSPRCVEQDSLDDVAQCIEVLLMTPVGSLIELPSYGIPDPMFVEHLDRPAILGAIDRWEPRAAVKFSDRPDDLDQLVRRVMVRAAVR